MLPGGPSPASENKVKQRCMFFWIAVIVICSIIFLAKPLKSMRQAPLIASVCRDQIIDGNYRDIYVITAGHSRNFHQVEELVSSLQMKSPSLRIAVFDIGFDESQLKLAEKWLNVAVINFGLDRYPAHVSNLRNGVFRVVLVNEAASLLHKVLYIEPGYVVDSDLSDIAKYLDDAGLMCAPSKRSPSVVLPENLRAHLGVDSSMIENGVAVSTNIIAVDRSSSLYLSFVRAAAAQALDRAAIPSEFADTALFTTQSMLHIKEQRAPVCTAQASLILQSAFRLSNSTVRHRPVKRCSDTTWQAPDPEAIISLPSKPDHPEKQPEKTPSKPQGQSKPELPKATVESRQDIMNRVVGHPDELNPAMAAVLENGYTGYTLITSGSSDFYDRMKNLIGSVNFWAPEMPIIVYDLGLHAHQVEELRRMKSVLDVRAFPFEKYPPHFKMLQTYAFKPTVMLEAVNERFKILYLDTSMELRQSPEPIFDSLKRDGYFYVVQEGTTTNMLCCGTVGELTVEGTLNYLHIPRAEVGDKRMCAGGIQGYFLGSRAYHEVLHKAAACAKVEQCISPPGAGIPNHRFDQSVFSSLINHVGGIKCHDEPIFWGNEVNLGSERPTNDPTQSNSVVLYTRRGRGGSPYVPYIKYKE